jgi:hypothetical protein
MRPSFHPTEAKMKVKKLCWMLTLLAAAVLAVPERTKACGVVPPQPPGGGFHNIRFGPIIGNNIVIIIGSGFPVSLFEISNTHDCVCGIGVGMTGAGAPSSLLIDGARFMDINGNPIPAFSFSLDPVTTIGLANGPVLFPGSTWFGFHATVAPFSLPPGGFANLEFTGTLSLQDADALNNFMAQVASGVANGSNPVFDPNDPHHVTYEKFNVNVPEPTTLLLFGSGLAGVAMKMRKRRRSGKSESNRRLNAGADQYSGGGSLQ